MSQNQLTTRTTDPTSAARAVILPAHLETTYKADRGQRRALAQRLSAFVDWLDATGRKWTAPDLAAYRDAMLADGKAGSTVSAHLSTIRGRYTDLLADNAVLAELDDAAADYCAANGWEQNPANVTAAADRLTDHIRNAISPRNTRVKVRTIQDRDGGQFLRLTQQQASALIAAPGTASLKALRDTALIALALATGARAAELSALVVGDHKAHTESGALALRITDGKGNKQRLVPYGALEFAVAIIDTWLTHAGITEGPIFRGFYRGGRTVRKTALTVMTVERIVGQYPVVVDGTKRQVKPHDLRRTYAKLAYLSGMEPVAIQQNLGHADLKTTLAYIGDLDDGYRQPSAFLTFDLATLPPTPLV
jgi:site-specific recombinase XerD